MSVVLQVKTLLTLKCRNCVYEVYLESKYRFVVKKIE